MWKFLPFFLVQLLLQQIKVDTNVRMSKENVHSGLPRSCPTAQISDHFLFWTPYFQPDHYPPAVPYQPAVQYNFKTCIFFSHCITLPMPCRSSCTHCSNFPCPISLLLFPSIFWEKNRNVPINRQRRTRITVCHFTSAFQQKCKHISHFYPSFRVKMSLKIETLQATVTRNNQDYSLTNTLWPEMVFFISELLWFLLLYHMLKKAPSTSLESVSSLTMVWNRTFTS